MPQAVEGVVGERHRNGELGEDLECQRPGGEAGGEHGALEVPADSRRDQVEDAEDVEAAGEGNAGDTVEGGAVPGDLRLVDAEMGCDRAVQALLCEDLVRGLGGGHGRGGGVSAMLWSAAEGGAYMASRLPYLRCVVKAVPMAMAAGAANLLAGVWAATGRWLAGIARRGRGQ